MSADWQISAGFLSEAARPALFALAALASLWVLADSRRRFAPSAVALWTLFTLVLPHVVLPLYLIARAYARPTLSNTTPAETPAADDALKALDSTPAAAPDAAQSGAPPGRPSRQFARRLALPLVYAATLLGAGALYFYADYRSADAHLARARQAKLDGRDERAVAEYRAALRRADDAHVRKLLGLELLKAGRWEEALAELRAAEVGGEPDDALSFHIATALSALGRPAEAVAEYRKFLQTRACTQPPPDLRCETARARVTP